MKDFLFRCFLWSGVIFGGALVPSVGWAWTPFWNNGYCQQTGQACRSTIGNAGGAGACCDPASGTIGTCVQTNPCAGTHQQKWPLSSFPLQWSFHPNGMTGKASFAKITADKLEAELQLAWNAWSTPACTSFTHKYLGRTTAVPDSTDKKITIYLATEAEWAQLGQSIGGALAFAAPRSTDKGVMFDGDIIVNPRPRGGDWGIGTVTTFDYDLVAALSHEIGHTLGFGHTPDKKDLMYYTIKGLGPTFQGLGTDDRDAVCATYPKTNSCNSTADCGACFSCSGGQCGPTNPAIGALCKPCQSNAECGTNGQCVDTAEGGRCLQTCSGSPACCPAGYRCQLAFSNNVCVPMTTQCPVVACTKDADCGRNGVCQSGRCDAKAATAFNYRACLTTCKTSSDCGGLTCHTFANGTRHCLNKCAGDVFCPSGYSCRGVSANARYCVPDSLPFCPCRSAQDCATSQICNKGQCQSPTTGKENDFCNDNAPCNAGLVCVALTTGARCLRSCLKSACPGDAICQNYNINTKFCVGKPVLTIGEVCDGITRRCKEGLRCVPNKATINTGICVQPCQLSSECPTGDVCTNSDNGFSFCGCRNGSDCSTRNLACTDLGRGFRLCYCAQPPCDQSVCGNNLCESALGEDCSTCAQDCACSDGEKCDNGVCRKSDLCGNGTCDIAGNESCATCPQDCTCKQGESCSSGVCRPTNDPCGDGQCENNTLENCSTCPQDCSCPTGMRCDAATCRAISTEKCGDGVCEVAVGENCGTCAQDCGCKDGQSCLQGVCQSNTPCGDGTCDGTSGENCSTCASDCACAASETCRAGVCEGGTTPTINTGTCGDGVCALNEGETCSTCQADCGCKNKQVCTRGACVSPDTLCPPASQDLRCGPNGTNCTLVCQQVACGCQTSGAPSFPLSMALLLAGLLIYRRRSHPRASD